VADHCLGDIHRDVLAPVVDGHGVANHFGDDRRTTRPGLDDLLLVRFVECVDLLEKMVVDKRTLFEAARHFVLS
jgi:hypothetical protein